jgi:outer membrane protein assembly factor BamB
MSAQRPHRACSALPPRGSCLLALLAASLSLPLAAADWPAYQHDLRRSGATDETLDVAQLRLTWTWRSPQPPQPAWAGPARWDAYAGHRDLPSMRNYDLAFHPIAVGNAVYFGSSADDTVRCLDAETGREIWSFMTDGPVRLAPTWWAGKLYFGSDDGYVYCLRAADGQLLWKFHPAPPRQMILHNGRFISPHPCRTGVLVDEGTAYFAHALLPWETSYLCAVDAETGRAEGPGRYLRQLDGMTLEGTPAATSDLLVYPQGRVAPQLFRRADGQDQGQVKKSSGGSIVVVSLDAGIFHGPGADSRKGEIRRSNTRSLEMIASHGRGNALVCAGQNTYMLTDDTLVASDLVQGNVRWSVPSDFPHALIAAGNVLYAGGRDEVGALAAEDGQLLWRHAVQGNAHGLAVAHGRLLVSTDEGGIHTFCATAAYHDDNEYHRLCGRIHEVRVYQAALTGEQIAAHAAATADRFPAASPTREPLRLAAGPWLQFVAPGEAVVRWQTTEPTASELEYGIDELSWEVADRTPKTDHELCISGLRHKRLYWYAVRGQRDGVPVTTDRFECDTHFDYTPPPVLAESDSHWDDANGLFSRAAEDILARTGVRDGICLVYGSGDGRLAFQLARHSRLRVIGVETDLQRVQASRTALVRAGVYGTRIAIHHVASLAELPLVGRFANLVVSERMLAASQCDGTAAEVSRLLRPDGGIACLGQPPDTANPLSAERLQKWLADGQLPAQLTCDDGGVWASYVCPPLPGAGQWTHLYGSADNSAYGGEQLGGAASSQEMAVQWLGEPGPRFQPDRNGRKPAPLSTAGRLYLQGLHRIVTLDAYNGAVLWSLEIPGLERFNMPRDCGNWCADRNHLYAAVRDRCWRIDAASGQVVDMLDVLPATNTDWQYDWGYLAVDDQRIIGSAVKQETAWTEFWGGENAGWYDARNGPVTFKVCSDNLFARDKTSGRQLWTYRASVILNSTITVADGRIYFVECRNPSVKAAPDRRIGSSELWQDQVLVALDAETGSAVWEHPLQTQPGDVVFYMAHSRDRLVLTASTDGQYHVYGLSTERGERVWEQQFPWPGGKGDHGKAMSRPAIVGEHVYVRPAVMALADGALAPQRIPDGKCGTYACTADALIFRTLTVSMWNRRTGTLSDWPRLRPDCWLSTIPAAGMLLSPEGGGGCSCGTWLETSIGFMPIRRQTD